MKGFFVIELIFVNAVDVGRTSFEEDYSLEASVLRVVHPKEGAFP